MRILALEERIWWQNFIFTHEIHPQLPLTDFNRTVKGKAPMLTALSSCFPQLLMTPTLGLFSVDFFFFFWEFFLLNQKPLLLAEALF